MIARLKTSFCCLMVLMLNTTISWAQELKAEVSVRRDRVQGVDKKVFDDLETSIKNLLNNRKWTEDSYKPNEKIDCNFMVNVTQVSGNIFNATLTVQATRPVFNSDYKTNIVNFIDKDFIFKYEQNQTVEFDEMRVAGTDAMAANLPAVFAYYVNLILGLTYDSFEKDGGTTYFKKVQNIVLNAPSDGNKISGWKSADGMKNRYWISDQFLNTRFAPFRAYYYQLHRLGFDNLVDKPEEGKKFILEGIPVLEQINAENPNSILMQFFFNAKGGEYVNFLKSLTAAERKDFASRLSKLDIVNANKLNEIK